MPLLTLLLPVVGVALLYALWKATQQYLGWYNSSLRYMPGPPCSNILKGNLPEMRTEEPGVMHERWVEQYGHVFLFKGSVNVRLFPQLS